jgi:hypothetical protein
VQHRWTAPLLNNRLGLLALLPAITNTKDVIMDFLRFAL